MEKVFFVQNDRIEFDDFQGMGIDFIYAVRIERDYESDCQ